MWDCVSTSHAAMRMTASAALISKQISTRMPSRAAFTSPFWPFVLGATYIGQEGLDFHWYCHAVVHWNLPRIQLTPNSSKGVSTAITATPSRRTSRRRSGQRGIDESRAALARAEHITPWELACYFVGDE